jgi:hypothetical protein
VFRAIVLCIVQSVFIDIQVATIAGAIAVVVCLVRVGDVTTVVTAVD